MEIESEDYKMMVNEIIESTKNTYDGNSYHAITSSSYLNHSLELKNATIVSDKASCIYMGNGSLENVDITSKNNNGYGVTLRGGTNTFKDVNITTTGTSSIGLRGLYDSVNTTLENVTINSNNIGVSWGSTSSSYQNNKNLYIKSGRIYGRVYGINTVANSSVIHIGLPSDELSIDNPVIIGDNTAAYVSAGKINLYSGKLYGISSVINTEYNELRTKMSIFDGTEVMDEKTYKINYLTEKEGFLKVGDKTFVTFAEALDEIETTGTITVLNSAQSTETVTIPANKNITLDLNNNELEMTQSIINNGTFTITDIEDGNGKLRNVSTNTITNKGDLYVTNARVESVRRVIDTTTTSNKKVTLNNAKIKGEQCIYNSVVVNKGMMFSLGILPEPLIKADDFCVLHRSCQLF